MKFYTDPGYFFELWKQEVAKDAKNQIKKQKKLKRVNCLTFYLHIVSTLLATFYYFINSSDSLEYICFYIYPIF